MNKMLALVVLAVVGVGCVWAEQIGVSTAVGYVSKVQVQPVDGEMTTVAETTTARAGTHAFRVGDYCVREVVVIESMKTFAVPSLGSELTAPVRRIDREPVSCEAVGNPTETAADNALVRHELETPFVSRLGADHAADSVASVELSMLRTGTVVALSGGVGRCYQRIAMLEDMRDFSALGATMSLPTTHERGEDVECPAVAR